MSPISINTAREMSKNTELNRIVNMFNNSIISSAREFKNSCDINLSYVVDFFKKKENQNQNTSLIGQHAYNLLPEDYKKSVDIFHKEGYSFDYEYMDWYVDEPYSERWEKKYILKIKW